MVPRDRKECVEAQHGDIQTNFWKFKNATTQTNCYFMVSYLNYWQFTTIGFKQKPLKDVLFKKGLQNKIERTVNDQVLGIDFAMCSKCTVVG